MLVDHLDFDPNAESDSTCREDEACLCYWCKREKLRCRGIRPSLRRRADAYGLDTDRPGWVCDLRGMGEISDGEWEELYGEIGAISQRSSDSPTPALETSREEEAPAAAVTGTANVIEGERPVPSRTPAPGPEDEYVPWFTLFAVSSLMFAVFYVVKMYRLETLSCGEVYGD